MLNNREQRIIEENPAPDIRIPSENLIAAKFTSAGITRYKNTLQAYSKELFAKSVCYGDIEQSENYDREVTERHVRRAAEKMGQYIDKKETPTYLIYLQASEYICSIAVGVGASNTGKGWGMWVLFIAGVLGLSLFFIRQIKQNKYNGQ